MDSRNKISSLVVEGLFDAFDYSLRFDKGHPLILTSPNGYGKTTLLRILAAFRQKDLMYFYLLPFRKITLALADGSEFRVVASNMELASEGDEEERQDTSGRSIVFGHYPPEHTQTPASFVFGEESMLRWHTELRHVMSSATTLVDMYVSDPSAFVERYMRRLLKLLTPAQDVNNVVARLESLPDLRIIESQRLYKKVEDRFNNSGREISELKETLPVLSERLKEQLRHVRFGFLIKSQRSDREFIRAILDNSESIGQQEYETQSEEIDRKISRLSRIGLIDRLTLPEYNADKSYVLKSYLHDLEGNLREYDDILDKLDLFGDLLARKKLVNKEVEAHVKHGLRIRSTLTGGFIDLRNLSSGEKNQIILLYDFIFNVPDGAVLLIDEPEISLHVAWLIDFMTDLEKIAALKKLTVVVATHSPQVINGRWDYCYDLYEAVSKSAEDEEEPI